MARPLVLVADDDADILSLVRLRLERSGYAVVSARNGTEALDPCASGARTSRSWTSPCPS